ncbi:MAG: ABC transporter substrate-binding protein [Lachnospiraceae bacterium]|nr:ABC transporter substrate-binding protein [Lachnospiraceae bacterium]
MIATAALLGLILVIVSSGRLSAEKVQEEKRISLTVTTTFTGEDGNSQNFQEALSAFQEDHDYVIKDLSSISDETFKTRVLQDFATGSEPDVLFFFTGADANSFIRAGKVVSLEEIRSVYPEFASNMQEERIPHALTDDKAYAVPLIGYWEALYVNTRILDIAGVDMPGKDYTMEEFAEDCRKIKAAGFLPIAGALGDIPHYWWEYAVFNRTGAADHLTVPASASDRIGQNWVKGLRDLKDLYEGELFAGNTLNTTDDESFDNFTSGRAAFLLDGSWKLGSIELALSQEYGDKAEDKLKDFSVTYVPGTGKRSADEMIGGVSMGYYISRKAWDDPEKREAAVAFVSYMTSDPIVRKFARYNMTALKNTRGEEMQTLNGLEQAAADMVAGAKSFTPAVQDLFQGQCREPIFDGMPRILTGKVTPYEAVKKSLELYNLKN